MKKPFLCLFLFLSFSLTTQSFARVRFVCPNLSIFKPKKLEPKHYLLAPGQLKALQRRFPPRNYGMEYTFLESQGVVSSLMKKMAKAVKLGGHKLTLKRGEYSHSFPVVVGLDGVTFPLLKNLIQVDVFKRPAIAGAPTTHFRTYTVLNEQALRDLIGKRIKFKINGEPKKIYNGVVIDARPSLPQYGIYEGRIEGTGPKGIFLKFKIHPDNPDLDADEIDSSHMSILEILENTQDDLHQGA